MYLEFGFTEEQINTQYAPLAALSALYQVNHTLEPLAQVEIAMKTRDFSPADVAAFRIDFAEWLTGFPRRDRRIIGRMISGDGTFAVADRFGVTPGRISQLRRKYELSWRVFQREALLN